MAAHNIALRQKEILQQSENKIAVLDLRLAEAEAQKARAERLKDNQAGLLRAQQSKYAQQRTLDNKVCLSVCLRVRLPHANLPIHMPSFCLSVFVFLCLSINPSVRCVPSYVFGSVCVCVCVSKCIHITPACVCLHTMNYIFARACAVLNLAVRSACCCRLSQGSILVQKCTQHWVCDTIEMAPKFLALILPFTRSFVTWGSVGCVICCRSWNSL